MDIVTLYSSGNEELLVPPSVRLHISETTNPDDPVDDECVNKDLTVRDWALVCSTDTVPGEVTYSIEWLFDGEVILEDGFTRNDTVSETIDMVLPSYAFENVTQLEQVS